MSPEVRRPRGLRLGQVLDDRFEVVAVIGEGAYGHVYRAHDRATGDAVALKATRGDVRDPDVVAGRARREARVCAELRHPATVRLREVGALPDGAGPYLVFDLVRGWTLGRLLEQRPVLAVDEAVHVVEHLLGALGEAHAQGVVHRDIKPDNLMIAAPPRALTAPSDVGDLADRLGVPPVTDPVWGDLACLEVRVLDFGLARLLAIEGREVETLTRTGSVAGTAWYMSPEQVRNRPDVDGRADLYAAAMLLHQLLTGAPPFDARTVTHVALKHLVEPPPPLPGALAGGPLEGVYQRAAAKSPADRYPTAEEMASALRAAQVSSGS